LSSIGALPSSVATLYASRWGFAANCADILTNPEKIFYTGPQQLIIKKIL
jgi:hypothetical protein